jgi:hypothetical protein
MDPNWNYTKDEIAKNLALLEGHYKSGNTCPDCLLKHSMLVEGLAEEGMGMAETEQQRLAMLKIADFARNMRKKLAQI